MAKTNRQSKAPKTAPRESANVLRSVTALHEYYQLGLDVVEADRKNSNRGKYNKGVSMEFAARKGRGRDYIDKARQLATIYTHEQFEQFCSLRCPDGMPLGRSLVIPLLSVKDKRKRASLQRTAAREGWSKRRLEEEIAKVPSDRPSSGGRRPRKARTVDDALAIIVTMSERWNRWFKGLDVEEVEDGVSLKDLPKSVREGLTSVTSEIKDLERKASRNLKRLRAQPDVG
jgi:hypothetical protein